jgi:2-polyprenyl-6-methoxyphenol hydroxylase-like FAD-dependent oxidoreductase
MKKNPSVGIVGGGPGGLTLARLLVTRGIEVTVLELDEHPLARPQGGSLDIHAESGQRALREAGLEEGFRKLARYDDQYDALYDEHGTLRFEHSDPGSEERPEIDRQQLRSLLLDSLPEGVVRWGSKVKAVEPLAEGRWRVLGEQGSLGEFDLVVGADGAWSKVRPLVSSEKPAYTGVHFIELTLDDVDRRHPRLAALIPRGKISVVGDSRGLIAQRSSNAHVRVYCMFRVPEEQLSQGFVDVAVPERARAQLKAHYPGWAPSLLAFIDQCNDTLTPRPIVALPVGHRWTHRPGVTLLGDAAHVMSPFSGEGVNMAMLDALELALALTRAEDWSRAVADYEAHMFERAAEAAEGARQGLDFVSEGALAHVLEHYTALMSTPPSAPVPSPLTAS